MRTRRLLLACLVAAALTPSQAAFPDAQRAVANTLPASAPSGVVLSVELRGGINAIVAFPAAALRPLDVAGGAPPPLRDAARTALGPNAADILDVVTIRVANTVVLPRLPAITLTFPASTSTAGSAFSYATAEELFPGRFAQLEVHGPGTVSGQRVSFASVPQPFTMLAGHTYAFAIFTTPAPISRIYVVDNAANAVRTFTLDGLPVGPVITDGITNPEGIAVDRNGKIYVTNNGNNTVTTYRPDGTRTTPTIATGAGPLGIAVDAAGKIYVADNAGFSVTTYRPDGTPTTPTITKGVRFPWGIAIAADGSIYVANNNEDNDTISSYRPDGTMLRSFVDAADGNAGLAFDRAGTLYVASTFGGPAGGGMILTYRPDGTRAALTLTDGLLSPQGVAVDAYGKIYVANFGASGIPGTVQTFGPLGHGSIPTIRAGLERPFAIAIR